MKASVTPPTERISNHRNLVDTQRIEKGGQLIDPDLLVLNSAFAVRIAKTKHVGRDDAKTLGKDRNIQTPVCPGGDPWARTVNKENRRAFTDIVIIRRGSSNV